VVILGINISHDASICLFKDGEIIFYLEEERLQKIKHFRVTHINDKYTLQAILKLKKYVDHIDHIVFTTYKRDETFQDVAISEKIINDILSLDITINKVDIFLEDHHLHHAYNGFYNSGFKEAGVLVIDGSGSYINRPYYLTNLSNRPYREVESSYTFSYPNQAVVNYKHYASFDIYDSGKVERHIDTAEDHLQVISNYYGSAFIFNDYCKLFNLESESVSDNWLEAGKLMGLSSYGNDNKEITWVEDFNNYPMYNMVYAEYLKKHRTKKNFSFQEMADIAKKVQNETKEHTIRLIQKTIEKSQSNNIVLSGGYFLNCVNNYAYIKEFPNINFYVDPICYDGGTAIGACFYVWHNILGHPNKMQKLNDVYLG
jgi:carbamoyltransferase